MRVSGVKFWFGLAAVGTLLAAAVLLYAFPPEQHAWYPRCAFNAITGFKCPGCGGLRAAHYLLHGDFAAAFLSNPLVVILFPGLALAFGCYWLLRRLGKPIPRLLTSPAWLWVILVGVLAFGVLRNLH